MKNPLQCPVIARIKSDKMLRFSVSNIKGTRSVTLRSYVPIFIDMGGQIPLVQNTPTKGIWGKSIPKTILGPFIYFLEFIPFT